MSKKAFKSTHGLYAGYADYRYGTKKKISLAPIWTGDKRKHRVNLAMDMLRDWRLSPFEKEGSTRAGIRSALCLNGHGWHRSDATAADVIAEALYLLGAERPTWDQGQPEYTAGRDNCMRCRGPIPPDLIVGERTRGFCSIECARAAMTEKRLRVMRGDTAAYQDAMDTIRRAEQKPIKCESCGKTFRPLFPDGKYCSRKCTHDAQRMVTERDCLNCGRAFTPTTIYNGRGLFCSVACKTGYGHISRFEKKCVICGTAFVAKLERAECCSHPCTQLHYQFKSGKPPRRITPPVFDYVFRMAA